MDKNYVPDKENLVEVNDLKMYFPVKTGLFTRTPLKAVDGVSFAIKPGETLGLVGESGCGKTTVGRAVIRLYTPTDGDLFFDGKRIDSQSIGSMRKDMQMVFQDPYSSLNPRMTVEDIIGEPLDVHKLYANAKERREKVLHLMELVGLNAEHATRNRQSSCDKSEIYHLRRGCFRPGRIHSGAGHQYVRGTAGKTGRCLSVHCP